MAPSAYDDFGRLFTVTDWAGRVTTYNYDNASRLTQITRPNGTYRTHDYDAAGQLRFVQERNTAGGILAFEELKYDSDGRITSQFLQPMPAAATTIKDGTTVLGTLTTPALAAGASATVSVDMRTAAQNGVHNLSATADAGNTVAESNETNNTATLTVTIKGNKVI